MIDQLIPLVLAFSILLSAIILLIIYTNILRDRLRNSLVKVERLRTIGLQINKALRAVVLDRSDKERGLQIVEQFEKKLN